MSGVNVPTVTLNNGVEMPQLGFGVFQVPKEETVAAVVAALEAGYRSIDTAMIYGNERAVGEALQQSGLDRSEVFITTKLWNGDHGSDATRLAFDASLTRLGIDYLDLYLIHWPAPAKDLYAETWHALEKLYAEQRVRAIGVSNFQPAHIQRLLDGHGLVPAVNQIELHPYLQQRELRDYDREHGITTEAWSPIAKGQVLADPVITRLAETHGKTPAQIVLRWHIELGNIVIPKSVTPARIRENIEVFDFELTPDDLSAIATLDRNGRTGPHPDSFNP
jgi:diketogulonate reductase-like aldo/keto reductase